MHIVTNFVIMMGPNVGLGLIHSKQCSNNRFYNHDEPKCWAWAHS